jgi:hypothetical protein
MSDIFSLTGSVLSNAVGNTTSNATNAISNGVINGATASITGVPNCTYKSIYTGLDKNK